MPAFRVYLVRHAKAEEHAAGGDAARRITADGRRRFEALLATLRDRLAVTRVVTSPYVRARQTAELLAHLTRTPLEEDPALASARSSARQLLEAAEAAGPGAALVGHNPEIADAIALASGREQKVRPGTIAAIRVDGPDARLEWIEQPERE